MSSEVCMALVNSRAEEKVIGCQLMRYATDEFVVLTHEEFCAQYRVFWDWQ